MMWNDFDFQIYGDKMRQVLSFEMLVIDIVYYLVRKGVSYKSIYSQYIYFVYFLNFKVEKWNIFIVFIVVLFILILIKKDISVCK